MTGVDAVLLSVDAVLLSYDEPLADTLHARLEHVLGRPVKRLHGVRGMRRAYRLCAEIADTEEFWLADGDFAVDLAFDFVSIRPLDESVSMRVWRAVNPVNGLIYGYGGLKLVRRRALRDLGLAVDVLAALPGEIEFCPQVAGVTQFNQSPFHAWKAGFRECAMLTRGSEYGMVDDEAHHRLTAWTASSSGEFARFAAAGSREGISFAREAACEADFDLLNNPDQLHERFTATHGTCAAVL